MQHLTDRFVQSCALVDPLVRASPEAITLLSSSSDSYPSKSSTSSEPSLDDTEATEELEHNRRPSTLRQECVVVVGNHSGVKQCNSLEVLYFKKRKWYSLASLPIPLQWYGATVLNNDIYITGGVLMEEVLEEEETSHHVVVDQVWRYVTAIGSWKQEPSLLTPRARHALTVTDDYLLIVGGVSTTAGTLLNRIDAWNGITRQWSTVGWTPEPMVRADSSLACWRDLLLEAGGVRQPSDFVSSTMDTYRIVKDVIEHLQVQYTGEHFVLPHPFRRALFVVFQDVFFLLWEEARLLYQLDPVKRSIRQLASPQFGRKNGSMTAVQVCILNKLLQNMHY